MDILRVHITAFTASFRVPFAYTGVQITLPVPTYSNILGLLGCVKGEYVDSTTTCIGFNFFAEGKSSDLERINRWDSSTPRKPKLNIKGTAIRRREFMIEPSLLLYLSNIELKDYFLCPKGVITLGRSQDVARIETVEVVEIEHITEGYVGGTLIPVNNNDTLSEGMFFRLPEKMEYDVVRRMRKPVNNRLFLATDPFTEIGTKVSREKSLYKLQNSNEVFYLHQW